MKAFPTLLMCLALLLLSTNLAAKETSDPNHKGWSGSAKKSRAVDWKPRKTKCENCVKIVAQYNDTMSSLLQVRYDISLQKSRFRLDKQEVLNFFKERSQGNNIDGLMFTTLENMEAAHNRYVDSLKKIALELEKQARYLQWAIAECEAKFCNTKAKDKRIKVGNDSGKGNYQPDISAIFESFGASWNGKVTTQCAACLELVFKINQIPGWMVRANFELQSLVFKLQLLKLNDRYDRSLLFGGSSSLVTLDSQKLAAQIEKKRDYIRALVKLYKESLAKIEECEKKYCPKIGLVDPSEKPLYALGSPAPIVNCSESSEISHIEVGPNNEVGSKAKFKEKAKNKALGMATGAVASLIGIGGGGKSKRDGGPTTYKDPVKKKNKIKVKDRKLKREIYTGGQFSGRNLLISTDLKKAPGKGTFHSMYIVNPRGWKIMPIGFYMYEIWKDWKLNVSWTRDTYVDNELVKHEEGGWSESWSELIESGEGTIFGVVEDTPIWQQLGFNTAVSGARSLGAMFPVDLSMLKREPMSLIIHVTDPKKDPVLTYPYVFNIGVDKKGKVKLERTDKSVANTSDNCPPKASPSPKDQSLAKTVDAAKVYAEVRLDNIETIRAIDVGRSSDPDVIQLLQKEMKYAVLKNLKSAYERAGIAIDGAALRNQVITQFHADSFWMRHWPDQTTLPFGFYYGYKSADVKPTLEAKDYEDAFLEHTIEEAFNSAYQNLKRDALHAVLTAESTAERIENTAILRDKILAGALKYIRSLVTNYDDVLEAGLRKRILELLEKDDLFITFMNPNATSAQIDTVRAELYEYLSTYYYRDLAEKLDRVLRLRELNARENRIAGGKELEVSALKSDRDALVAENPKRHRRKIKALNEDIVDAERKAKNARRNADAYAKEADDLYRDIPDELKIFFDDHIQIRKQQAEDAANDPTKIHSVIDEVQGIIRLN